MDADIALAGSEANSGIVMSELTEKFDRVYVKVTADQLESVTEAMKAYDCRVRPHRDGGDGQRAIPSKSEKAKGGPPTPAACSRKKEKGHGAACARFLMWRKTRGTPRSSVGKSVDNHFET